MRLRGLKCQRIETMGIYAHVADKRAKGIPKSRTCRLRLYIPVLPTNIRIRESPYPPYSYNFLVMMKNVRALIILALTIFATVTLVKATRSKNSINVLSARDDCDCSDCCCVVDKCLGVECSFCSSDGCNVFCTH
jgi:hypothetical protein